MEQKIIGGHDTSYEKRKFMASFRHKHKHLCSAFLISDQHLLTAAHCLDDFLTNESIPNFDDYSVEFGLFEWDTKENRHKIEEIVVHQCYNPFKYTVSYDLGLIKVRYIFENILILVL